jgi:hypothetical protein
MEKTRKTGVDRPMTGLSNWGLAFVFNKSAMGGGYLAEGTSAEGCKKQELTTKGTKERKGRG